MTTPTTVVVADDHAVVRSGLRLLLDAADGMHVVAEAGDVPGAVATIMRYRPAVAVLDLNMPGGSSLDAISALTESAPETAIVVLTMQDDPAFARRALRNGALGFVLKEAADEELLRGDPPRRHGRDLPQPAPRRPPGRAAPTPRPA